MNIETHAPMLSRREYEDRARRARSEAFHAGVSQLRGLFGRRRRTR